jgi:Txe/YoeB family toxin of Txe-Axe toxin-antitoxin module
MIIRELNEQQNEYLKTHQLVNKYNKAKKLFEKDVNHPSLNVELLEPKHLKFYSFRLDKKYRVVFIVVDNEAEVVTITNHYK